MSQAKNQPHGGMGPGPKHGPGGPRHMMGGKPKESRACCTGTCLCACVQWSNISRFLYVKTDC